MKWRPLLVAALAFAAIVQAAAGAGAVARGPARMLVYAQEWSLWPSRSAVPAGKLVVQLWNRGQDAHNLSIRRLRGGRMTGRAQRVGVTQSGALSQTTWHLAPGRYALYCSMAGHYRKGMHTTLVVQR
jgi:plastocyanin